MQWHEFQDTAERLARGISEGDWPSAISRGYYAVFHCFRELLRSHGLDIGRGGQAHFNLYTGLMNCGFPAVAAIAARIDVLRGERVAADYDLIRTFAQPNALSDVRESREIVADFQVLLTTHPAAQIVAGARRHLQAIGHLGKTP